MEKPQRIWPTGSLGERFGSLGTRIPTVGMTAAGLTVVPSRESGAPAEPQYRGIHDGHAGHPERVTRQLSD